MAVNPIQQVLQMLMQQGGAGNVPAMQPGTQSAAIAPMSPYSQSRDMMPTPRMGSTDQESEDTASEAGETMTPSDEEFQLPPMMPGGRPDVAPDIRAGGGQQYAALRPEGRRATDYNVERGSPEESEAQSMESYGDPRFGPNDDKLRDETEGELDRVHELINRSDMRGIENELRQAIEDDDQTKVTDILEVMNEGGIKVDELPPDLQRQLAPYLDEEKGESTEAERENE